MKYIIAPTAREDMADAWEAIARHSVESADRFIDRLFHCFEQLGRHPLIGEAA